MKFTERLANLFLKDSFAMQVSTTRYLGQPVWSPRNYASFSREAYQKNVIAFTAINKISQAIAGVPWILKTKPKSGKPEEIENHAVLDLIRRPNPMCGQFQFFEAWSAFYRISGNSFIEAIGPEGRPPRELYVIRPDKMKIVPAANGFPSAYVYEDIGAQHVYPVDFVSLKSPILHMKTFNPLDMWWGQSFIEAAVLSIDQHNEASVWNMAMMQNDCVPSGTFTIESTSQNPSGKLTEDQKNDLKREIQARHSGPRNVGRTMILQGGLKWQGMGFSAKDMNWIEGKNTSAKEIALALGMPPMLLGIKGDNTYSNQKEARQAMYEETVLPWLDNARDELNNWLVPKFGDGIVLEYDPDNLAALAIKRQIIWDRVAGADWLTDNEKRQATGYEVDPNPLADQLWKSSALLPLDMLQEEQDDVGNSDDGEQDDDDINFEDESEAGDNEEEDDEKIDSQFLEQKNATDKFDFFVQQWVSSRVGEKITQIYGTTRKKVMKAVRQSVIETVNEPTVTTAKAIQKSVAGVYTVFKRSRAIAIARTETATASSHGSREAAKALDIPQMKKEWIPSNDERSRDGHRAMEGVSIPMDEKFQVPDEKGNITEMDGPHDPSAPAGQIINCRCVLSYNTDGKSFNLRSRTAKSRWWRKVERDRQANQKRLEVQVKSVFIKEERALISALEGIDSAEEAEIIIAMVLSETETRMERVLKSNIEAILRKFGKEVLGIGGKDDQRGKAKAN